MVTRSQSVSAQFRLPIWLGAGLFGALLIFSLWGEHKVYILTALPYLLLAAADAPLRESSSEPQPRPPTPPTARKRKALRSLT